MPVLDAFFGFVFTAFAAWIYNIVPKYWGGIEFTTRDVPDALEVL